MRVYCIGGINIDFIFFAERWPREHEKIQANDYVIAGGGSAANTAVELAQRGRTVSVVGGIGDDVLGGLALDGLRQANVDVSHIIVKKSWKTGCAAIRSMGAAKSILTAGYIDPRLTLEALRSLPLEAGDHVHMSRGISNELASLVLDWKKRDVTLSWETNGRLRAEFADVMNIVFMNQDEHRVFQETGLIPVGWAIVPERKAIVAITLGAAGAEAYMRGQRSFAPAFPVQVVDRTGGGDAFNAGFLDAWFEKMPLDLCLSSGLRSAADVISTYGSRVLRRS